MWAIYAVDWLKFPDTARMIFFLFFSEQGLTATELAINYLYTKLLIAKEKHSQLMHITLQKYSGKMKTFLFLVKVFFLTWARQ